MDTFYELSVALREQGVGVSAKQPYNRSESDEVLVERYSEDSTARSNLEMYIAMYLSEHFQGFDQWMQAKAPVLGTTRYHHTWIISRAHEMHQLAKQCEALEPASAALTTLRNLLHEVA
ncbi:hypothetical protein [Thiobacillus sp.]|jgi:hypothetical protein|uniref:hypothetical protein n=1 Tax=Thiobacillus sp. TaxID=924 RepID=UPI001ACAC59F|nr:hypothetical protein [Thiobacillus sp.]MBN8777976.1 hypothetical protein [Thiobacillus sp.]